MPIRLLQSSKVAAACTLAFPDEFANLLFLKQKIGRNLAGARLPALRRRGGPGNGSGRGGTDRLILFEQR